MSPCCSLTRVVHFGGANASPRQQCITAMSLSHMPGIYYLKSCKLETCFTHLASLLLLSLLLFSSFLSRLSVSLDARLSLSGSSLSLPLLSSTSLPFLPSLGRSRDAPRLLRSSLWCRRWCRCLCLCLRWWWWWWRLFLRLPPVLLWCLRSSAYSSTVYLDLFFRSSGSPYS